MPHLVALISRLPHAHTLSLRRVLCFVRSLALTTSRNCVGLLNYPFFVALALCDSLLAAHAAYLTYPFALASLQFLVCWNMRTSSASILT